MKAYYYILLFIISISVSGFYIFNLSNEENVPFPRYSENEISLIYIGNSTCSFCQNPDLIGEITRIDNTLKEVAYDVGFGYKKIGISTDWNLVSGYDHLINILEFDELIIGNGWSNVGVLRYIYTDFKGVPAVPQVIVTKRKFNKITINRVDYRGVNEEQIILNLVGLIEIMNMSNERFTMIVNNDIDNLEIPEYEILD
jgi:hypothetical protein